MPGCRHGRIPEQTDLSRGTRQDDRAVLSRARSRSRRMTASTRVRAPLRDYFKPRILVMFALGFSSGLPFLLTSNTLGYWLRDLGTSLTAITFISWVGLAYSLKFLWAPIIDRASPPLLGRLGRRRGWMLLAQL